MRNTDLIKNRAELRCRHFILHISHTLDDEGHFYLVHVKDAKKKDLEIIMDKEVYEQLAY